MIVEGLLYKKIEEYGVLKITQKGSEFLNKIKPFPVSVDRDFSKETISIKKVEKNKSVIDNELYNILMDLRKSLSKELDIPPFAVLQESSIIEMTFKYPTTLSELSLISGIGQGKANKIGNKFIELIGKHVDNNQIE